MMEQGMGWLHPDEFSKEKGKKRKRVSPAFYRFLF